MRFATNDRIMPKVQHQWSRWIKHYRIFRQIKWFALHMKRFITTPSPAVGVLQAPKSDAVTVGHCGIMGHRSPRVNRTGEDVITTVKTLIGDFDALCKRVERRKKKKLILLLGGFHSNPSHHTAPWTDDPSGEQKHLERERDGNLTGIIVLKFQAGTSGDLVLSRTWIKNSLLLCHLVSCCTEILSGCVPRGETKYFPVCASVWLLVI